MSQKEDGGNYFGCGCLTFMATIGVLRFVANISNDYKLQKALDELTLAASIITAILLLIVIIIAKSIK